jgi:hypothetical protein
MESLFRKLEVDYAESEDVRKNFKSSKVYAMNIFLKLTKFDPFTNQELNLFLEKYPENTIDKTLPKREIIREIINEFFFEEKFLFEFLELTKRNYNLDKIDNYIGLRESVRNHERYLENSKERLQRFMKNNDNF